MEQEALTAVLHIKTDAADVKRATEQLLSIATDATVKQGFENISKLMENSTAINKQNFAELTKTMKEASEEIKQIFSQSNSNEITKQQTAIEKLTKDLEAQKKAYEDLKKSIDEAKKAEKAKEASNTSDKKKIDDYTNSLFDATMANNEFGKSIISLSQNGLSGFFSNAVSSVASFGKALLGLLANPVFLTIAGVASVGTALKWWYDYNQGIAEATHLTKKFTNLDGTELKNFRADVQAVADTFGKDFTDVLSEASAKSKQLGVTMQEALQKVTEEYVKADGANDTLVNNLVKSNSELERSIADVFDDTDGLFEMISTNAKIFINTYIVEILKGLKEAKNWLVEIWDENEWLRKGVGILANFTINSIKTTIKGLSLLGSSIKNVITLLNPSNWGDSDKIKEAFNNIAKSFLEYGEQTAKTFTDIFSGEGSDLFNKKISEFADMGKSNDKIKDTITYIEALQKKLDEAQKKLNAVNPLKTDPKEIERRKEAVKVLEDEIKKFNILITSESTLQRIQREREEAQTKLEELADKNASAKEIEAQKAIIFALDEQKKAYEDKISLASEYERLTNRIASEQAKLNKMSLNATDEEIRKQQEKIRLLEIEKAKRDEAIFNNSFGGQLKAYTDYSKEILKIEQDRKKKIDAINKANLTKEQKESKINSVNKFADLSVKQVQSNLLSEDATKGITEEVAKQMQEVVNMTAEELDTKIIELKGKISDLKKVGASSTDAKSLSELETNLDICINQFQTLQDKETSTANKTESDKKKWEKFAKYFSSASEIIKNVADGLNALSDEAKQTIDDMLSIADMGVNMITNISKLTETTIQSEEATAETSAKAISSVEKASAILAIISVAIQIATKIINLFKSRKEKQAQKEIEALQNKVDKLQRSYDALGKQIDKSFSADATKLINQQDVLLRQQKELLKQEIEAEKQRKKADKDKIKSIEEQIYSIDEILSNRDSDIVSKMLGKDYNSVLDDFSGAIISSMDDAETSVNDAVKNIGKSIKKLSVQQMLNSKLQPITEKYAKTLSDAMLDGVIDATEETTLKGLEKSIETISENYLNQFPGLWDEAEKERQGVSGGINSMSQDTAEEMNGRLTQIQAHTYNINTNVQMLTDFAQNQLAVLQGINTNTATNADYVKKIHSMFEDVTIRGVKMR